MNPKNKRKLCSRIARLLHEAFPFFFLGKKKNLNLRRNPAKDPSKGYLYVQKKPYSADLPPRNELEANERIRWNLARVEDWRERGMGDRFDRVAKEIHSGTYDRRSHTYRGHPEAVMAAAIKENSFLKRWLRKNHQKKMRAYRQEKWRQRAREKNNSGSRREKLPQKRRRGAPSHPRRPSSRHGTHHRS